MRFSSVYLIIASFILTIHSLYGEEVQDNLNNQELIDGNTISSSPLLSATLNDALLHQNDQQHHKKHHHRHLRRLRQRYRQLRRQLHHLHHSEVANEESGGSEGVSQSEELRSIEKNISPDAPLASSTHPQAEIEAEIDANETMELLNDTTPTNASNFTVVSLAETRAFPPDSTATVGPTQLIAFCNGRLKSFNKNTGLPDGVLNIDPDAFFASVLPAGAFTSDPRIRYDRFSGSWFLVMISVPSANVANDILIAVTRSPTITRQSIWTFYSFKPSAVYGAGVVPFADFPTLGVDLYALYIGANVFADNVGFVNSAGYVIPKGPLLNAATLTVKEFPRLLDSNFVGPITPQGVDNLNPNYPPLGYFIGVDANSFGRLMLRQVINPGSNPQISGNIPIQVLSTAYPLNVPHLGNNNGVAGYLDGIDDRLSNAHLRGVFLYTSHNIGVNDQGVSSPSVNITRNGCRWYQINLTDPNRPVLNQSSTLFQPGAPDSLSQRSFWIPSVMTNGLNQLVLGCSTAGAQVFINGAFARRFPFDPAGTIRGPAIYTQSNTAYNPPGNPGGGGGRRWGDYSHVSLDPIDNMTMWTVQEYCNATNSYGVRAFRIFAPPPPQIISITPNRIPVNQTNIVLTITGANAPLISSYYDPGPGFRRIRVGLQDVRILGIQVLNRRQIRVVVSTQGTTRGQKTAVVINPDNQAVAAGGLLTVQ